MKHAAVAVMVSMLASGCGVSKRGRGGLGGLAIFTGGVLIAASRTDCSGRDFNDGFGCDLSNRSEQAMGAAALLVGMGLLFSSLGDDGAPNATAPTAPSRSSAPTTSAPTLR